MESITMRRWFRISSLLLLGFSLSYLAISSAETAKCLKVYHDGGATAVVRSHDCPRWGPSIPWVPLPDPNVVDCSEAMVHTLRHYFPDDDDYRIFCDVDARVFYRGLDAIQKEATVGIVAVFDGQQSNQDSERAWKYLEEYFYLHIHFLFNGTYFGRLDGMLAENFDGSFHIQVFKEALLRAIHDMDIDIAFSKNGYTATIILMVDDQIFITGFGGRDENFLATAAGSYSGLVAASRSVCDVSYKSLGAVSPFNTTDGHLLSFNDSCLMETSSMKLKRLMSQGFCDTLRETYLHKGSQSSSSCAYLFKKSMVNAGFEGCSDKLVTTTVPVQSPRFSGNQHRHGDTWSIDLLKNLISGLTIFWFEKFKRLLGLPMFLYT